MTAAVLTPFVRAAARSMGRDLWSKKLLPVGDVLYNGNVLHFDRDYLERLAGAFRDRAYPQVPFQLAGDENKHTNDVERFGGDIVGMNVEADGLYVTLAANSRGNKVLMDNPGLGVSARIVEDYERSDGQFYPGAVQHVLGTLDPRIPAVSGGWKQFELANGPAQVYDLTGLSFTNEEAGLMPELSPEHQARLAKLLEIPEDKLDLLVTSLGGAELSDEDLAALTGDDGGSYEEQLTDDELQELLIAAAELDGAGLLEDPALAGAGTGGGAALSAEAAMAIELTNARADETERQLGIVQAHLAGEQFKGEQRRFAADFGIPPYITDLARPLLEGSGHIIEFSNAQGQQVGVDAGQVMRRVLTEVGKAGKLLDLSFEEGSAFDEPDTHGEAAKGRDDVVSRFRAQTGL
jgi:hypothetical protein